jgi:hypothetical protein
MYKKSKKKYNPSLYNTHPNGCVLAIPLPLEKIPHIWHNVSMYFFCAIFAALLTNCADVANFVFARRTGDRFDLTGRSVCTTISTIRF